MSNYRVSVPYLMWVTVEVEAEDKDGAVEQAIGEIYVSGYCGNGGADKLVGVTEGSIEVNDDAADDLVSPQVVEL